MATVLTRQAITKIPKYFSRLILNQSCHLHVQTSVGAARNLHTSSRRHHGKSSKPLGVIEPEDEANIVRSPWNDVEIPEINLADYVWQDVHKIPDNVALVCGMTGRSYTYGMAHGMAKQFGSALLRLGAKKGDVLGMVVPNIPEFPIAFLGAAGVGVTLTTMNPSYRPEEIARQFEISQARYVLTIGLFLQNVKQACDIYGNIEKIIVLGMEDTPADCASFVDMLVGDDGSLYDQDRSCDPHREICVLPFSSGTTGPPKGVCLTHYNLVANAAQASHPDVAYTNHAAETGEQEVTVAVLPFFHIFAMETIMIYGLRYGCKIVTLPKFEPEMFIKALVTYKPTILHLVPPVMSFLAKSPTVKSDQLASVKFVNGGAAPFGPTLIESFMEKVKAHGTKFIEGYGLTEASPVALMQPKEGAIVGSCGYPLPNTMVKIIDMETGEALGPGKEGELCISGPQVMMGYYRNKKTTRKTIVDGWLKTGDVAKYGERKQFIIVDRLKELVKVKGFQVAPSELEDLLRGHPGVIDVAVVGVPDERAGELPRAYVIRKNRNVMEQSIIDFVAENVAPHKKLGAGVMFVESLPKNQTGKTLRRELKAQVFKGSFGY